MGEDVTSLGTLKFDIFEVFGYGDLEKKKLLQIWMRLEEILLDPFFRKIVATLRAKILTIK